MGLENREYLRDDFPQPPRWRPNRSPLSITAKLILAMVAVFLLQLVGIRQPQPAENDSPRAPQIPALQQPPTSDSLVEALLELRVQPILRQGQVWRLLTYAFCHDRNNPFHLILNALLLHFAGQMLLTVVPSREFLWFYLAAALFAGIVSLLFCWAFAPLITVVGASGAVLAVLTLAALYYPRQEVLLMGILPIQMRWILVLYIAYDLLPLLTGTWRTSTTANFTHLGGVAFGALYFYRQMHFSRWFDALRGSVRFSRRKTGNLRIYSPSTQPDSQLDEQVDRILQKISQHGEASLTSRERNILTQASRQLRKKQTSD
jgi:membrane associated rhomboid family serine protease